jgi:hypothetical protein
VRTLADGPFGSGTHGLAWDGRNEDGKTAAAGVYHYVLRTPSGQTSRSMLLLR